MVNRHGAAAEERAANWLKSRGYKIVARNFRTRYGELDIVAIDAGVLVIVEVKARADSAYGGGLAAITAEKLGHMQRVAGEFIADTGWEGPVELAAIAIDGSNEPELVRDIYLP